jgi:signal transduction histidine kinase
VQFAGLVGLLGLGRFVAGRDARLELVEQRAAALEGERVAVAKLAAAEERTRIAREIHDIAGQSVGVMIVGARGARDAVRERPADAERILDLLEQSAQRSLDDLRQSVGMLRSVAEPAERHPTPGIEAVDALVTEMRAAGLRVALRRDEDLRDDALSPVVALSAYRIVQEGLANALRHAPASSVEVRLARHGRTLDVEVDDDGADAPPVVVGPGGHGLLGMRERASLVGGNVEAGPRPDGGFRVRARLPIEGVA